jgi:hypothetical protein
MTRRQHGVVVTHVDKLSQLADSIRHGQYDTIKVVTGWGLKGGWTSEARRELLNMAPHVIVRTVAGDPSVNPAHPSFDKFPIHHRVVDEVRPWYAIRPDIMIEIGNEPNIPNISHDSNEDFIWEYKFFLSEAIERCRNEFPLAKLISPGLLIDPSNPFKLERFMRFNEIRQEVFRRCHFIGVHFYEHIGFAKKHQPPATEQLAHAIRITQQFYGDMRWYVTEYGINDDMISTREKGQRYAGMAFFGESSPKLPDNVAGLTYYHLNMQGDIDPRYHIFPDGDIAFGNRVRATPVPEAATPGRSVELPLRFVVIDPVSRNPEENVAIVRRAPHMGAAETGRLKPGTKVTVDGMADGWAHLSRANRVKNMGFIPLSLLRQKP